MDEKPLILGMAFILILQVVWLFVSWKNMQRTETQKEEEELKRLIGEDAPRVEVEDGLWKCPSCRWSNPVRHHLCARCSQAVRKKLASHD